MTGVGDGLGAERGGECTVSVASQSSQTDSNSPIHEMGPFVRVTKCGKSPYPHQYFPFLYRIVVSPAYYPEAMVVW